MRIAEQLARISDAHREIERAASDAQESVRRTIEAALWRAANANAAIRDLIETPLSTQAPDDRPPTEGINPAKQTDRLILI
jgi:hypothetical protein